MERIRAVPGILHGKLKEDRGILGHPPLTAGELYMLMNACVESRHFLWLWGEK